MIAIEFTNDKEVGDQAVLLFATLEEVGLAVNLQTAGFYFFSF